MRPAARILFATLILTLITACSNETADFHEPGAYSACMANAISGEYIVKFKDSKELQRMKLTVTAREQLRASGKIEWLEPNYRVRAPRRPSSFITHPLSNPHALMMGADYAWQKGFRGQGVVVAVVDSGIDSRQPRIRQNIVAGYNFVDNTPVVRDETGHGTHIAGIIAARPDQEFGGMAPRASLVAADFMDEDLGDEFNAIRAIDFALSAKARIINNSWSNFCSQSIQGAFASWQERDVIFVNAAGNDSMNIDVSPIFPANLDLLNGITVGSVNRFGERSEFSNYGRNVVVYAPGEEIFSLSTADFGLGFLVPRSGTSMATAFVSGALALVLSARPEAKAVDVVREMKKETSAENAGRESVVNVRALIQGLN